MREYERLTQWTENGASLILGDVKSIQEASEKLREQFPKACNKLAEIEDKFESGKLIELPCNQVFYVYNKDDPEHAFVVGKGIKFLKLYEILEIETYGYYRTYKEAEAKLKELKGEK